MPDKQLSLDLGLLREEVQQAKELSNEYGLKINLDSSPASVHKQLANRAAYQHLMYILELLIASVQITNDGYPAWELKHVVARISEAALAINRLRVEDYAYCVPLKFPPFDQCQVYRGTSTRYHVTHHGTGREQYRGSSNGIDYCGGPLRTEEEITLGMCGSCLKKYGPELGKPILSQDQLASPLGAK